MQRADPLEKTDTGKNWGRRRTGRQRMRWLDGTTDSMDVSLSSSGRWWRTGKSGMLQSIGSQRVRHGWATDRQQIHQRAPGHRKTRRAFPTAWLITDKVEDHFHGWQPLSLESHWKDGGGQGIGASDELMLYLLWFLKDPQLGWQTPG